MTARVLVSLAIVACAAPQRPPATATVVVQEPCREVVTLGVDLSRCRWVEEPTGLWRCEGADPIVVERRVP